MKIIMRALLAAVLAAVVVAQTGCAGQDQDQSGQENRQDRGRNEENQAVRKWDNDQKKRSARNFADGQIPDGTEDAVIRVKRHHGVKYVPLRTLSDTLEFQSRWNPEKSAFGLGGNDILFEFKVNSNEVWVEDEVVRLQHPTVEIDGETFIPEEAVDEIFGAAMNYRWTDDSIVIKPNPDAGIGNADGIPDFADDPQDPNAEDQHHLPAITAMDALPAAKLDVDSLIDTAKRYIGVKYEFGAGPYPQSKLFDCSSFTQYVFGKHGVRLPRLSVNQSKQGVAVSRSNLRKGDLMFFYWPGRYRSNDIVGHVGIYIGDGKMIHSSPVPEDGVQISDINAARWKRTFLKARRVAS